MDDNRPSILPYFIAFGLLFLAFVLFVVLPVHGQSQESNRYLVLARRQFDWQFSEALPFVLYDAMAWSEETGFSEIGTSPVWIATFIDLESRRFGYIWQDADRCFLMLLYPEVGSDNHPHVSSANWISCELPTS